MSCCAAIWGKTHCVRFTSHNLPIPSLHCEIKTARFEAKMFTMRLGLHRHIPCRASRGLTSSDTAQHCKNCYSNSVKKEHHIFVVLSVFISKRNISNKGLFFQSMQQITIYQAIIESYDQLGLRLKFSCSEVASHFRNQTDSFGEEPLLSGH